jgi:hypothetical protein
MPDPEQLPLGQLPLQTMLRFMPPPSYLAIPYLEAVRRRVSGDGAAADMAGVYASSCIVPPDVLDQPLPPNGHEPVSYFDLRQAIAQLQLDRGRVLAKDDTSKPVEPIDLHDACRILETVSFSDAHVSPRAWARMEVSRPWSGKNVSDICRFPSWIDIHLGLTTSLVFPSF